MLTVGDPRPVKLKIFNRMNYPIWVYSIRISAKLDAASTAVGCSIERDFRFIQLPKSCFPFKVPEKTMNLQ